VSKRADALAPRSGAYYRQAFEEDVEEDEEQEERSGPLGKRTADMGNGLRGGQIDSAPAKGLDSSPNDPSGTTLADGSSEIATGIFVALVVVCILCWRMVKTNERTYG